MEQLFSYIIGLGAAVMMPTIFTILGVCIGPALSKVVEIYGLQLKVYDMGWPAAAFDRV